MASWSTIRRLVFSLESGDAFGEGDPSDVLTRGDPTPVWAAASGGGGGGALPTISASYFQNLTGSEPSGSLVYAFTGFDYQAGPKQPTLSEAGAVVFPEAAAGEVDVWLVTVRRSVTISETGAGVTTVEHDAGDTARNAVHPFAYADTGTDHSLVSVDTWAITIADWQSDPNQRDLPLATRVGPISALVAFDYVLGGQMILVASYAVGSF